MDDYQISWTPTIGDPTLMGWLTVCLYFISFIYCARVYLHSNFIFSAPLLRQKYLWLALCFSMLAMGVNKQLDIQSLFTDIARYYAIHNDWYEQRHFYQKLFVGAILGLLLITSTVLFLLYKPVLRKHFLAISGLCFLLAFIFIRASSFHNVDTLLFSENYGIRLNWLFEISGILLIILNAYQLLKSHHHDLQQL